MTTQYINYILLAIGIFTVLGTLILIFLDKLKGEDIYFNIDVKEQEMKKVIDDAEEILSELNFTSDVIVKEIEEKINHLNKVYKNVDNSITMTNGTVNDNIELIKSQYTEQVQIQQPKQQPTVEKTTIKAKFKPVSAVSINKAETREDKPKSKQQQVFEMADEGISVIDIAKALNMGQGEVTLILSLKNEES